MLVLSVNRNHLTIGIAVARITILPSTPRFRRYRSLAVPEIPELVVTSQHNCFEPSTTRLLPRSGLPVVHREEYAGEPSCSYQYNCHHGKRQDVCALQFQNRTAC